MPLYEYFCKPCNGVFELLRLAREAGKAQPCPRCDEDATRIMSKQWSAFIFREGFPRRLPDDGGYWHLGHKVSQPILGMTSDVEHPEVRSTQKQYDAPSIEEIEQFEFRQEVKAEIDREHGMPMVNEAVEARDSFFTARLRKTSGTRKQEAAKQRVGRAVQRIRRQAAQDTAST